MGKATPEQIKDEVRAANGVAENLLIRQLPICTWLVDLADEVLRLRKELEEAWREGD